MEHYEKLAIRTENKAFDAIGDRLIHQADEVLSALNTAILALQQLDYVVKKQVFYGKPPKTYDAPLFPRAGELNEKQKDILRTPAFLRLLHGFMGIGTEAGEGLEALAKHVASGEALDKVNVGEEAGDIFWYLALIVDECGTDFDAEQLKNIRKLALRHGAAFSDVRVMERDLAGERSILEERTLS